MDEITGQVAGLEQRVHELETQLVQDPRQPEMSWVYAINTFICGMMMGATFQGMFDIIHAWGFYKRDNTQIWIQKDKIGNMFLPTQVSVVVLLLACGFLLVIHISKRSQNFSKTKRRLTGFITLIGLPTGAIVYAYLMGAWEMSLWAQMMGWQI